MTLDMPALHFNLGLSDIYQTVELSIDWRSAILSKDQRAIEMKLK